jgi:DMSO/TMAO reductase YedYZ molybdopterin-dependent catalytic subunit
MLQVRTIPERMMEWALLVTPPELFEAALLRFGFDAKRLALYGAVAVMLVLLAGIGAVPLWQRWPIRAILALGLGLWLLVMTVIMPLTSAGFFAIELIDGTKATVGGYLAVALAYAGAIALVRALVQDDEEAGDPIEFVDGPHWRLTSRRSAVGMLGGAAAVFGATVLLDRWGPKSRLAPVLVRDPQEPVPSGGIEHPNPHPNLVAPEPTRSVAVASSPIAAPVPSLSNSPSPSPPIVARAPEATLPEPPPPRQLARDKDGAALPSGRRPGELAELITSNEQFYVVTKNAGGDPTLRPDSWRLRIDGEVQRPVELDYATLRKLPAVEVTKTLECISNFVARCELAPFGCDLISTARWKGVRVAELLALAGGLKPGVVSLATIAADEFTTALPIEAALAEDTLLVYEMNGQVLPRDHGYPARVLVPGRYGMKNAKWVVALRAMSREFVDWYGQRSWSKQGIVKTMTRIDLPSPGAELPPGQHRLAGIAYGADRGVARVEFSVDDGQTWRESEIERAVGRDTWVRWQGSFSLAPGADLTIRARASDGTGAVQEEAFSLPQPDGGAGWPSIDVKAKQA